MKKKIAVLLIAISLLSSFSQTVYAHEEQVEPNEAIQMEISPRYTNISRFTVSLTRSGSISCRVQTTACDYSLTVDLQQNIDGSWEDVDTWEEGGSLTGSFSTTASLERGQKYRVRAYLRVYDDNGTLIETATKYSVTV